MDTIVKVLNEKVEDGNAKTIVEALKQIDSSAEGDTVAEVLKNMNLGGGGGASINNPKLTITVNNPSANPANIDAFIRETDGNLTVITADSPISIHRRIKTVTGYAIYEATQQAYFCQMHWTTSALTYTSALTNCTIIEDGDDVFVIVVTDPTKEASAELVFTAV